MEIVTPMFFTPSWIAPENVLVPPAKVSVELFGVGLPPELVIALLVPVPETARDVTVTLFPPRSSIPLAFALLLAFLLSPMVKRVEGWGIPRGAAAGMVLFVAAALLVVVGWLAMGQMMQVGARLRNDAQNIQHKIAALQGHSNSLK